MVQFHWQNSSKTYVCHRFRMAFRYSYLDPLRSLQRTGWDVSKPMLYARDQFSLCNQTCRYTHLLSFLPDIFVGQHSRLSSLVRLIASEMELAFSETGITMPPWRQAASMMSKWKPLKVLHTPEIHKRISFYSIMSDTLCLCYDSMKQYWSALSLSHWTWALSTKTLHQHVVQ